jgi:PAS domain S-box-containing protein
MRYTNPHSTVDTTTLPPLLHAAPVAIACIDLQGRLLDANQTLLESSGYTLLELKGVPFSSFLDPGDETAARTAFAQLVMGIKDSYQATRRYRTRSGDVRDVDLIVSLVRDPDDMPLMCLAVLQDVTDRRQTEQTLERLLDEAQRAHRDAEAASRVKDEFLATLSHELRTPLNAVLGWAHILRARHADAETRHALDVIERNAVAQARLIDDLLDVSRIITGKIRLQMEQVDIGSVAGAALESLRPTADAKKLAVDFELPAGLPRITGDPQRIQQIFWNLLSNAVKFSEPGGRVALRLVQDGRTIQATVSDTGIGIAPEILPFVFDRFTQGDSSPTRAHAGLGLGLAIVRHLVELHGGTVVAESPGAGRGAAFHVQFPIPA